MRYSELLRRLKPHGIEQIGRLTVGGDSAVMLGRPKEAVFPFPFQFHTFYAPAGQEDFLLDPEEITPLLRRFDLSMDELQGNA